MLTCHQGSSSAYTWHTTKRALGPHVLRLKTAKAVTAVAISPCGHFGYLGGADGALEKFNLQVSAALGAALGAALDRCS